MKNFNFLSLLAFVALFSLASCGGDSASSTKDEARASLTADAAAPTAANPASPVAAAPAVPVGPLTSLEFTEDTYDFGEVMEGDKVVYEYAFKNTGNEPLIISNAKGSCGCTVPDWPREPIPVGGSSVIKVQFDSKGKGKVGGQPQSKRVTITANTDPAQTFLTIKGKVNKTEEAAPANPS